MRQTACPFHIGGAFCYNQTRFSAPIAAFVFGGVTGTGTDVLVAAFSGTFGLNILGANMAQGVVSDPIDKIVTFLIVWALLKALPSRLQARFSSE